MASSNNKGSATNSKKPAKEKNQNKNKKQNDHQRQSKSNSAAATTAAGLAAASCSPPHNGANGLSKRILLAMALGVIVGVLWPHLGLSSPVSNWIETNIFALGGEIFIRLLTMLVVPIVFVSLVVGVSSLGNMSQLGRIGGKAFCFYLLTTALAIVLALIFATIFPVGVHIALPHAKAFSAAGAPSIRDLILGIVPTNPLRAMQNSDMLAILFFAIIFGMAITVARQDSASAIQKSVKFLADFFESLHQVLMTLITMIMQIAPIGVFLLLTHVVAKQGLDVVWSLMGYFCLVLVVLFIQWAGVYSLILFIFARLNPLIFMRKLYPAMLFAFSVSSSNASIPVVLKTVEQRLGVSRSVAAFVIPLGATINMDGTAIMQGVATLFIAHAYHIALPLSAYLTVIGMATLASVGTAGVPGVGLITLAMVLTQVNLPVSGIALIIGIDRLLDMARTAVNISGDAMISCLVAKSEKLLNEDIYRSK